MKITLFTADKIRHNYLINLLSNSFDEVFVIQEYFPKVSGINFHSNIINEYFNNVNEAEIKIFDNNLKKINRSNVKILNINGGDLNNLMIASNSEYFNSDMYIVFGSSYIKNDLVNFLIKNHAINIHMGISPYYRGTDCNFWALFDNNLHLVGATIHYLSKGLDNGKILYHAMSNVRSNPFDYTMSTVRSAFHSLVERIKNESIFRMQSIDQDRSKEIRYSKNIEFTEKILIQFENQKLDMDTFLFNNNLLIRPFFL